MYFLPIPIILMLKYFRISDAFLSAKQRRFMSINSHLFSTITTTIPSVKDKTSKNLSKLREEMKKQGLGKFSSMIH